MKKKKSIEWYHLRYEAYERGIIELKKSIKQQENDLEKFIEEIDNIIEDQFRKKEYEETTLQSKKKLRAKEVQDVVDCLLKYPDLMEVTRTSHLEYYYNHIRQLGTVRKYLISSLKSYKNYHISDMKRKIQRDEKKLKNTLNDKEKFKEEMELAEIEPPVLNINEIETKIENQVKSEKLKTSVKAENLILPNIHLFRQILEKFQKGTETPESIKNLIENDDEREIADILYLLYQILENFKEFVCQSIYFCLV